MCADEILGCTRVDTQEVAIVPLALHLLAIVIVGSKLEHHFLAEDRDGLAIVNPLKQELSLLTCIIAICKLGEEI